MWNHIIPRPQRVLIRKGQFVVSGPLRVHASPPPAVDEQWIGRVNAAVARLTALPFPLLAAGGSRYDADLFIHVGGEEPAESTADPTVEASYRLEVTTERIEISAHDEAGVAHAVAVLAQAILLSGATGDGTSATHDGTVILPAVEVVDRPASPWRGFMLDTSRHFFPVESLERLLDVLWLLRLNRFHLHLTDDQGWRFPVPEYPRLTEVGAVRPARTSDDEIYGGSYTADELRTIDRHAALLGIVVVPEADLPGHASAALAAYPELSCSKRPWEVETRSGVFHAVLCASEPAANTFISTVFRTLADLFHGPYIHIGGDEVPTESWNACPHCGNGEDPYQSIVRAQAEAVVAVGRRPVAWDEASGLDLPRETIIINWRTPDGALTALKRGYDLVLAPEGKAVYLDHKHRDTDLEAGRLSVCTVADTARFAPLTYLTEGHDTPGRIIGGQANVWTEAIPYHSTLEYMTIVRLTAAAQGIWSGRPAAADAGFFADLDRFRRCLYERGYNVYPGSFD